MVEPLILAAGAVAAYFLTKKEEPIAAVERVEKEAPETVETVRGICVKIGTTRNWMGTESMNTVEKDQLRAYTEKGYLPIAVRTGIVFARGTRSEHEVQIIYACPKGVTPPTSI